MYATLAPAKVLKAKFHEFLKNNNLKVIMIFPKFLVNIV